jgi:hypothetical protein
MYYICPNSLWIKSYDPWGFQPSVPGLWEKISAGSHLKSVELYALERDVGDLLLVIT